MSSRRASTATPGPERSLTTVLLVGVIVVSLVGIVAILAGVPNPFTRERTSSPEAVQFYVDHVVALDVAAKEVVREAEFNIGSEDVAQCLVFGGSTEHCIELQARFAAYVTRMEVLLTQAAALQPPASDWTTKGWVEAFVAERTQDRDALQRLAGAASTGWNQVSWGEARKKFDSNPERGLSDKALMRMLPNHDSISIQ